MTGLQSWILVLHLAWGFFLGYGAHIVYEGYQRRRRRPPPTECVSFVCYDKIETGVVATTADPAQVTCPKCLEIMQGKLA
jgi:hypothetical protein